MYPKQPHLNNPHFPFTEGATGTGVRQAVLVQRQQDSTGLQNPTELPASGFTTVISLQLFFFASIL